MLKQIKHIKGEVATALVILIAAGTFIIGGVLPKLNPLNLLSSHQSKKKTSFTVQKETSKPILLETKDGKQAFLGKETEYYYNTGKEEGTPKLSVGERIGNFFSHLTTFGLMFVLFSLLFFGGVPIVWVFKKYLVMKQALKRTVQAIRETDRDTYDKLKPNLESKHDRQDKQVIDKIKMELN